MREKTKKTKKHPKSRQPRVRNILPNLAVFFHASHDITGLPSMKPTKFVRNWTEDPVRIS